MLNVLDEGTTRVYDYMGGTATPATVETITYEFGGDTYNVDASFTVVLDGSGKTFKYKSAEDIALGHWYGATPAARMTSLSKCIYYTTNNYTVASQDGASGKEIVITALQYGDEISHSSFGGTAVADGWNKTENTRQDPDQTRTFVPKSSITNSAAGTTPFERKWYWHTESEPSSHDQEHWKVIGDEYLKHYVNGTTSLEGDFLIFNEHTTQFGALTGIQVGPGENVYTLLEGSFSLKNLIWSGVWRKNANDSIIPSYTSKEVPAADKNTVIYYHDSITRDWPKPINRKDNRFQSSYGGD